LKTAIKILVVILLAAAVLAAIHHLPNFQGLMREIHGH
jgi:hypothetical protein